MKKITITFLGVFMILGWFVPLTGGMRDAGGKYLCFYGVLFSLIMTVWVFRFLNHYQYSNSSFSLSVLWFISFFVFSVYSPSSSNDAALYFSLFSVVTGIIFVTFYSISRKTKHTEIRTDRLPK